MLPPEADHEIRVSFTHRAAEVLEAEDDQDAATQEEQERQAADDGAEDAATQINVSTGAAVLPEMPGEAVPYFHLWMDGLPDEVIVSRWGTQMLAVFCKQKDMAVGCGRAVGIRGS